MEVNVRFPLVNRWDFNGLTGVAFIDGRASSRGWHRSRRSRGKRMSLRCEICVVERLLRERRRCRWERWCGLSPCWAWWERCRRRWWRRYASRMPKRTRGGHCKVHRSAKRRYRLVPAMLRSMRCARTIRLWSRDNIRVLAKLRDQVLGRHDVDRIHRIIGRNNRNKPTEICGIGEKVIRRGHTAWNVWNMMWHDQVCVKHQVKPKRGRCAGSKSYTFWRKKWHQIPNVGRSIVTPKESVGATRLTGSLSWGPRQIARYSAVM